MKNKPNLLATPTLINVLKGAGIEICSDGIKLIYDTDKIFLDITLNAFNDDLGIDMWIGDKNIDLTDKQQDIIYKYAHLKLKESEEKEAEFKREYDVNDFYPQP